MPRSKGDILHRVAVKRIQWAVGLFTFGGLTSAYGGDVLVRLSDCAGATAIIGSSVMKVVIGMLSWTLIPLGGSPVGAAVAIQTLAPKLHESERFTERDAQQGGHPRHRSARPSTANKWR